MGSDLGRGAGEKRGGDHWGMRVEAALAAETESRAGLPGHRGELKQGGCDPLEGNGWWRKPRRSRCESERIQRLPNASDPTFC